jgi:hypothetical protein
VAVVGALVALIWLPARAAAPVPEPDADVVLDAELVSVD